MIEVASCAQTWKATPFKWEASLKGTACDCRGLLSGVARELGRPEANYIEARIVGYSVKIDEVALLAGLDRVFQRKPLPRASRAAQIIQPGEVLAFRIFKKVQHLGIMSFNGRFIHAYSFKPAMVLETPLDGMWLDRLAGVWAWRDLEGATS